MCNRLETEPTAIPAARPGPATRRSGRLVALIAGITLLATACGSTIDVEVEAPPEQLAQTTTTDPSGAADPPAPSDTTSDVAADSAQPGADGTDSSRGAGDSMGDPSDSGGEATSGAGEGAGSGETPPSDGADPGTQPPSDGAGAEELLGEGDELDCAWPGNPVISGGFPAYSGNDSLLVDARLAGQGTHDRFVLELDGDTGAPTDSYTVRWVASPPAAEGSGAPVAPAGDWYLEIRATASMYDFDTDTAYAGPTSIVPGDTDNVHQALSGGSFEGSMLWVLGADDPKGFRVLELSDPSRLVVDVCVGGMDWPPVMDFLCPDAPAMPADAILGSSIEADVDGDGEPEDVLVYFAPSEGKWHVRVEHPVWSADDVISDSDAAFEASVLGALGMNALDGDELFLQVTGGAYTRTIGVYTIQDCELIRTSFDDSGVAAGWLDGASVSNVLAADCDPGAGTMTQFAAEIAGFDDDGVPLGWNTTTDVHELNGTVWSAVAGPPDQGVPGAAPPYPATFDCPLG